MSRRTEHWHALPQCHFAYLGFSIDCGSDEQSRTPAASYSPESKLWSRIAVRPIRVGAFNPDLAPADRVLQVADTLAVAEEGQGSGSGARDEAVGEPMAGSEGESENSVSHGEDDGPFELPGLPAVRAPFAEVELARCRIHHVSGIAHCLRHAEFFYCGRRCTPRYSMYAGVGTDDPDVCLQCTRAMNE